ncbi:hypothetical protein HanXRQr2_Chr10g0463121 [Helianthus annuus]|uniref:Uncharacterized protein n=1 Tax=Helianthus annuus TaxID=4232 RepID=A0A9K3I1Q1_HELAN|nr:hypothetical protein HanXRQr2_Chr10g0463121 [Helianthus annuus]KAJ0523918.1 hypothetical protein HanIR_Chr10g0498961 [Helianthus annuus]KAJ0885591.1 hypothetical protein HanPSC8_Chr10g0446931 [Helianthus annuus]
MQMSGVTKRINADGYIDGNADAYDCRISAWLQGNGEDYEYVSATSEGDGDDDDDGDYDYAPAA